MSEAIFKSVNEALRFAFQYRATKSPSTPMSRMHAAGGAGNGLAGLDSAGQAGMILGALDRVLTVEQRCVIVVRYGAGVQHVCPCCGHYGHPNWWNEAVTNLSLTEQLRDLPKPIREAVVMKTVGRAKIRVQSQADGYEVSERQIRRRISAAKDHFGRIENAAIGVLQAHFGEHAGQLLEIA